MCYLAQITLCMRAIFHRQREKVSNVKTFFVSLPKTLSFVQKERTQISRNYAGGYKFTYCCFPSPANLHTFCYNQIHISVFGSFRKLTRFLLNFPQLPSFSRIHTRFELKARGIFSASFAKSENCLFT